MIMKAAASYNVLNGVAQEILCWLLFVIRMTFVRRKVNFSIVLVPQVLKQGRAPMRTAPLGL